MVKMHKLTKGGQTIFPATIYDAVVNPKTRKSLTTELSELESIGFRIRKFLKRRRYRIYQSQYPFMGNRPVDGRRIIIDS